MLVGAMSDRGRSKYPDILTPREWEVLGHIRAGLSNEERAELVGGRFELRSSPGHGSELTVTVEAT